MKKTPPFAAFGSMVREARKARNWTQAELATRLKVGQQAVSNWERGTSRPETEVLVLRLSEIFPEHDRGWWRQATRYRERGKTTTIASQEIRAKPVQPLLDALPLDQLSFQQFQGFCALLLELIFDGARVNLFGVEGNRQWGIDIEVRLRNGRYETFQCKREKRFGPGKVRQALREHKIKCDRAVILLSRKATVAARKAIAKSRKWELWDAEDIARRIRKLSPFEQRRVVDTYFRAYRKDFLGISDGGAFETPDEYFAPLLQRDAVFSHAWNLVGRDRELERLMELTGRDDRNVTLLVGSGGIGKSRLVRALATAYRDRYPDRAVFVLAGGHMPSPTDYETLMAQPSLVIIEDAHEHPQIRALLSALARVTPPVRLLITARPYAAQLIRSEALQNGLHADDDGTVALEALTLDQAESVAQEILRDRKGPVELARDIARLARGSTAALVVGSYLVAAAKIHPSILNSQRTFHDWLVGTFRDALAGRIGPESERVAIRETLDLIAVLQPIDPESPAFSAVAERVLQLPIDRIKRAIQLLHGAGILLRRGRMLRIVPDLLAEYVLDDACRFKVNDRSMGYLERVIPVHDEEQLANVLLNVSKLDWRLSEADESGSQIADVLWTQLESECERVPEAQEAIVRAVANAAYYQPRRALECYDWLHDRGHAGRECADLLKHAAMHFEYVEEAAGRLWELGREDQRRLSAHPSHPRRILNELAAIEPGKPVEYCERVVRFAMQRIIAGEGGRGENGAFGILRAALATEGHTSESRGYSVVMRGFAVQRDAVSALRQTITDFLIERLRSADLVTAFEAAAALEDALRFPTGLAGRVVSELEQKSWADEFTDTLRRIRVVIAAGGLDPFVTIRLQHTINWHAHVADPPMKEEAQAVVRAIPRNLTYLVSLGLADGWGHLTWTVTDDTQKAMAAWQEELKRIVSEMVRVCGSTGAVVDLLRERIRALRAVEGNGSSPGVFVDLLTELFPECAYAICASVIANPEDPLRDVFGEAFYRVTMLDPERGVGLGEKGLELGDLELQRSISGAYGARLCAPGVAHSNERALTESLIKSEDELTVHRIIRGVAAQGATDRPWALTTLLSAPIDRLPKVADEVCGVFATGKDLGWASLSEATVLALFDKLERCPSIDGHWVGQCIELAAKRLPSRVVEFLIRRIERGAEDVTGAFHPIPYTWERHPRLKLREAAELPALLKRVREWLLSAPRHSVARYWGSKLYAVVAEAFDQVALSDMESWAKSGDSEQLSVIAAILAEAPGDFVLQQRAFVVGLLEHAATVGKKCLDNVRSAIWASAVSGPRHRAPGQPFPEDERLREASRKAMAEISRQSPAWALFDSLKQHAERSIRQEGEEDAELFDE